MSVSSAADRNVSEKKQSFVRLAASLDAMSPLRVLSRGYSITAGENGKLVKSVGELTPGDLVKVLFSDGRADCRVENVEENGSWQ